MTIALQAAPKAVIFDWDNTLVDSWGCIQAAMNRTLSVMGHPEWDIHETKRKVALSLRDSFPQMFGDRWTEARDVFYAAFEEIHLDYLKPLPGAAEMLEGLAALGVTLSVVSNKNGRFLRQEAEHLGWSKHFHRLVGATDAAADKPSPEPVHLALAESGILPGPDVWFCGDAEVDMHCAANTGCTPILLRIDEMEDGEFDNFPPRCHVEGCETFVALVSELVVPISSI